MSDGSLTLDDLREDIAEVLEGNSAEIEEGVDLTDFGLDSIRLMLLAQRWSFRTGRTVEFAVLAERPELGAWRDYLIEVGG